MTKTEMFNATLVSGRQYRLLRPKGLQNECLVFDNGQPVPVSLEVKSHLERSAVDPVETSFSSGEIETDYECKFKFEPIC